MAIIRTYGLHWTIAHVDWGRQNSAGTLLGAARRSKHARQVDLRDQRGVYALYADYELVYVGQTGAGNQRLFRRLRDHKKDHLSERWNRFSWFGTQWVTKAGALSIDAAGVQESTEVALNILEALVVAVSEPRLNLQRGRWGKATQYYQWWQNIEEEEADD
jgi:hypothetical protein